MDSKKYQVSIYDIAKKLRQQMTLAEKVLWKEFRNRGLGVKFRRQTAFILGTYRYVVDFFCYQLKLIIEIDGDIHNIPEIKEDDIFREDIFITAGYLPSFALRSFGGQVTGL